MTRRNRRSGASDHLRSSPTWTKAKRFGGGESTRRGIRKLLEEQDATARIVQLVHETYGPDALPQAWDEFRCLSSENSGEAPFEFNAESPFLELFTSWLAHTWTPAKLSDRSKEAGNADSAPTEIFLAQHPELEAQLARYLKACIETPFSFFEVLNCKPGRGFTCCDLICQTRHSVLEGATSTLLRAHQVLYARIVEVDSELVIDAAAPWPIPKDLKPAILALRTVILENPSSGVAPMRQLLLAREMDLRSFYWGFAEQAFNENSLQPPLQYNYSPHKAAERLLIMLVSGKTAAENKAENDRVLAIPEVRQQVVSIFTDLYENWVDERLAVLGNKTALEAIATPEGKLKVAALLAEIESDFLLLPFSLEPQIFRRMRERLGIFPTESLH